MQGLTIQEPWASLLVKGKKQFETRDWKRNYRGLLAIHSGKKSVPVSDYPLGLEGILDDLEITQDDLDNNKGKIIAIATLKEIHLMTDEFIKKQSEIERITGFWEPGRYAWELTDITEIPEPIYYRGMPGLFAIDSETETEIFNQIQVFKCPRCHKIVPWSQGVDDDQPSLCDDCWELNRKGMDWAKERMNAIESKWGGSLNVE